MLPLGARLAGERESDPELFLAGPAAVRKVGALGMASTLSVGAGSAGEATGAGVGAEGWGVFCAKQDAIDNAACSVMTFSTEA